MGRDPSTWDYQIDPPPGEDEPEAQPEEEELPEIEPYLPNGTSQELVDFADATGWTHYYTFY